MDGFEPAGDALHPTGIAMAIAEKKTTIPQRT
jgi:hypothetical protein